MAGEPTPTIRAVVFDIGGVLLDWDPRALYDTLIPDEAELDRFLAEVCTMEWNATIDAGRPMQEACDELAAAHPHLRHLIDAWARQDDMVLGPTAGTTELVDQLRDAGTPLFLLTNMPSDVFADRLARYEVLGKFDGAVVSGDEGVLKPGPEIFAVLIDRFALEPPSTLFIDDSEANVAGARRLGFVAHHFRGAGELALELRGHGLLPVRSTNCRSGSDALP